MNNPPTETALDLLKRAEALLSALHGSVARHDNLAANLGCAGCELRDQIRAALPSLAVPAAVPPTTTDRAALREELATVLHELHLRSDFDATDFVDAVLAVPSAGSEDTTTTRADTLAEAADWLWAQANRMTERGQGVLWAAERLRRLAADATPVAASPDNGNGTAAPVAPSDRADALTEGADALQAYIDRYRSPSIANWTGAVAFLRRLAAETQPLPPIHANDVAGFCPACGHGVLTLGEGGHVTCTLMDCPKPEAADELLHGPAASAGVQTDEETNHG